MPGDPYRAPLPIEVDPYAAAWATLRRRRAWSAGFLVAYFVVSWTCEFVPHLTRALPVWVTAGVVGFVFLLPHARFRCPHCRRKGAMWNQCAGCGIEVGTPRSVAVEARKAAPVTKTDA